MRRRLSEGATRCIYCRCVPCGDMRRSRQFYSIIWIFRIVLTMLCALSLAGTASNAAAKPSTKPYSPQNYHNQYLAAMDGELGNSSLPDDSGRRVIRLAVVVTGQLFRLTEHALNHLAVNVVGPQLKNSRVCADVWFSLVGGVALQVISGAHGHYGAQATEAELLRLAQTTLDAVATAPAQPVDISNFHHRHRTLAPCSPGQVRIALWEVQPDHAENDILQRRFGLSHLDLRSHYTSKTNKSTALRRISTKVLDNLLHVHEHITRMTRLSHFRYTLMIRSRSDNIFFIRQQSFVTPSKLRKLVPNGALIPDCRHWGGLNDKYAVMGEVAAAVYMRLLQTNGILLAHDPGNSWQNPERLVSEGFRQANTRVQLLPVEQYQGSHAMWLQKSKQYCFRSYEQCTSGEYLEQAMASDCPGRSHGGVWSTGTLGAANTTTLPTE